MTYLPLQESLRLLEGEPPGQSARLSRRRRCVPLAVDRDGDVAATLFLRRGVSGVPWLQAHSLELTGTGWRLLGGGGGQRTKGEFDQRPVVTELGAFAVSRGGGGSRRLGVPGGWISWAEVRCAVGVESLRVDDRVLPLAEHGLAIVVWGAMRPLVTALDAAGNSLGTVGFWWVGEREGLPPD